MSTFYFSGWESWKKQFSNVKFQGASDRSKLETQAPLETNASKSNVYTQMSPATGLENKLAASCRAALLKESLTVQLFPHWSVYCCVLCLLCRGQITGCVGVGVCSITPCHTRRPPLPDIYPVKKCYVCVCVCHAVFVQRWWACSICLLNVFEEAICLRCKGHQVWHLEGATIRYTNARRHLRAHTHTAFRF